MDLGAGELYFVREIDPQTKKYTKFVKIGLVHEKEGRDSLHRLSEHQTGNPRTLILPPDNYFSSPAINRVEAMMHKVFARNRVSGEWFEFETEREVLSAIKKAKALSAEVVAQIPTFTKAIKLGQSEDNGKTIKATAVAQELIEVIAVSRAKRSSLSEISDLISSKLKSAITDGVNVRINELETLLRSYEPLKGVEVGYPSELRQALAPYDVTIRGVVYINGEPMAYETEVNLNSFQSIRDVERLIGGLLESFKKAEGRKLN